MSEVETALADLVKSHRRPPDTGYLSIVEAVSSRAFGGFLGSDDLARMLQIEIAQGPRDRDLAAAQRSREADQGQQHCDDETEDPWSRASKEVLAAVRAGHLALEGRKVTKFGTAPRGEREPIAGIFFADNSELVISPTGTLYDKKDPSRDHYYGVVVRTDEFLKAFPVSRRKQTASGEVKRDILAFALQHHSETGQAPPERLIGDQFPQLSRSSLRAAIDELPGHLQRKRGR